MAVKAEERIEGAGHWVIVGPGHETALGIASVEVIAEIVMAMARRNEQCPQHEIDADHELGNEGAPGP